MAEDTFDIESININAPKTSSAAFEKAKSSAPARKLGGQWKKVKLITKVAFVFTKSRDYKKEGDPKFNTASFMKERQSIKDMPVLKQLVSKL